VTKLDCRTFILEMLFDFVEGTLGPDGIAAVETHLEQCDACRAYLATYCRTRQTPGAVIDTPMPEEMKLRLRRALLERLGPDAE
jgi:anti-sigma factor RsiW